MASDEPIDLIRLEGEDNSVIVRITGKRPAPGRSGADELVGEILVDTAFVRGSLATSVSPEDLTEWRETLDVLDGGEDTTWREGRRAPELSVELDPDGEHAYVTVADHAMSQTTVTATVLLTDEWFDEAYDRLDATLRTWPMEGALRG
ncbi:DUF5959 family protein [Streptomyces aurantiacus]|uniref:Uncharacterized protein n=1 Tax=Streptomyces aurantiacus JA 4570 TaxID=1286094 RepID=S3ZEY7_9ACTN|nr:DUF5959 family protein [Streptomyces aurantiacus]EPH41199.1 hypothetical protein STRAU_5750 [Streptomyces aurantiacus JA 4570]